MRRELFGYTRDERGKIQNYRPITIANTLHTTSGNGGNTDQFVGIYEES